MNMSRIITDESLVSSVMSQHTYYAVIVNRVLRNHIVIT